MEKLIANFMLNEMRGILRKHKTTLESCGVNPEAIGLLARYVFLGYISKRSMKALVDRWVSDEQIRTR